MAAGFVYVLVNSSTPGLVKVGKTSRDPEGRATELSRATGVPTPFVVAFDRYFEDCDAAELLAHQMLKERGWRPSDTREFFAAKASDVVKIIAGLPDISSSSDAAPSWGSEATGEDAWDALIEQAERLENGEGTIRDTERALTLYEQAFALGSSDAGMRAAWIVFDKPNGYVRTKRILNKVISSHNENNARCMIAQIAGYSNEVEDHVSATKEWCKHAEMEPDYALGGFEAILAGYKYLPSGTPTPTSFMSDDLARRVYTALQDRLSQKMEMRKLDKQDDVEFIDYCIKNIDEHIDFIVTHHPALSGR